ncbi:hypothetical protein LQZ21_11790 [Treponema sp. TIM-1]|uniref:hypothetical protein n=1 Tax=Treponema sp. TIM-1 TaxID=2898417 RepID=UPI003980C562
MSQTLPEILRFLVLVPHRETVKILRDYSRGLFAAGFPGAFSFPTAVPLALVSRPYTGEELQGIARMLRQASLAGGRGGKIPAGPPEPVPVPDIPGGRFLSGCSFFGPVLDLPVPELSLPGLIYPFPALVLTTALAARGDPPLIREPAPPLGAFSFRAAATANMVIRPLDGRGASNADPYSLEWKIGRLRWLPAEKNV